jgi:hypothetical protein
MMRRPDRLNRLCLGLLGLLLAAAGGYGLGRSSGAFGTSRRQDPVLLPGVRDYVADHHDLFWLATATGCVVLALVALVWLRAQLRFPRPSNDDLTRTDQDGSATLQGGPAADAFAADVDCLPGVASAAARIWGDPHKPAVYLRVEIHDDAQVDALRTQIETESLDRLRHALQANTLQTDLDLRLVEPHRRALH